MIFFALFLFMALGLDPAHAEPITLAIASTVGIELAAGSAAAAIGTAVLTTTLSVGLAVRASFFGRPESRPS